MFVNVQRGAMHYFVELASILLVFTFSPLVVISVILMAWYLTLSFALKVWKYGESSRFCENLKKIYIDLSLLGLSGK